MHPKYIVSVVCGIIRCRTTSELLASKRSSSHSRNRFRYASNFDHVHVQITSKVYTMHQQFWSHIGSECVSWQCRRVCFICHRVQWNSRRTTLMSSVGVAESALNCLRFAFKWFWMKKDIDCSESDYYINQQKTLLNSSTRCQLMWRNENSFFVYLVVVVFLVVELLEERIILSIFVRYKNANHECANRACKHTIQHVLKREFVVTSIKIKQRVGRLIC